MNTSVQHSLRSPNLSKEIILPSSQNSQVQSIQWFIEGISWRVGVAIVEMKNRLTKMKDDKVLELVVRTCDKSPYNSLRNVGYLIWKNGNINEKDSKGNTALQLSIEQGNVEVVRHLLSHSETPVNQKYMYGQTELMRIVGRSHSDTQAYEDITKLFLTHPDVLVNERDEKGWTALMWTVAYENSDNKEDYSVEKAKFLLAHSDILVNERDIISWDTALILAAENNYPKIVELLVSHLNMDLRAHDQWKAALERAIQKDYIDIYDIIKAKMREQGIEF